MDSTDSVKEIETFQGKAACGQCPLLQTGAAAGFPGKGRCLATRNFPIKTKKRDGHCPVSFFLKRRRKTERLAGAWMRTEPPLYKWYPPYGFGRALWYSSSLLFPRRPLAFDGYIVHLFCRICKMRDCTMCCNSPMHFCAVCTVVHSYFIQKAPVAFKSTGARNMRFVLL